jgi:hypothetical protein
LHITQVCATMTLMIIVLKGQLSIKSGCIDNCQFDNNWMCLCNNDFDDHHFKIRKWFVVIMFLQRIWNHGMCNLYARSGDLRVVWFELLLYAPAFLN